MLRLLPSCTGPVRFPQPVRPGYYQIPEGLKSGPHLPEHNGHDNLRKPRAGGPVWEDKWLHRLIPKEGPFWSGLDRPPHSKGRGLGVDMVS